MKTSDGGNRRRLGTCFAACVLVIASSGCDDGRTTGARSYVDGRDPSVAERGDVWGDEEPSPRRDGTRRATSGIDRQPWTVILHTFTDPGHPIAAATMLANLGQIDPGLRSGAWVHTEPKGSKVLFGRYESAGSPDAQQALTWVKQISLRSRTVFPRAMLVRVTVDRRAEHPHDIATLREQFPNVDPLYSLQVASWSDFESGELTLDQIQEAAERYTLKLRAAGHDAYVHHDDDKWLSVVTVGVFNIRAIEPRSGLYSAEVDAMIEKFPHHLVNGEMLLEAVDRRRPEEMRPQQPFLVLVPR